jgi:excisionase family DNA binding protein
VNKEANINSQELLTIEEVTHYLNSTEHHIRSLVFKKEIPFLKVGRLIRFRKREIDSWLEMNRQDEGRKNIRGLRDAR